MHVYFFCLFSGSTSKEKIETNKFVFVLLEIFFLSKIFSELHIFGRVRNCSPTGNLKGCLQKISPLKHIMTCVSLNR